ncbi:methyltransferase domain-containing protein [Proteinivorax tanatarense]|uniref:Methyltransferase domain-containing protein n=1 Tax=Proteinivorax tanatarense TaxID=1260629 RepID=A0AAU7VKB6_9FIRM
MVKEVEEFYDSSANYEWERLNKHKIEFEITKRYLDRYIQKGAKILDVGGGPGRYSIYLAQQGHDVTLLDLSSNNISLAKQKAEERGVSLSNYIHGNVLDLSKLQDQSYDVVLCMGPMYHLTEEGDRKRAIRECLKKLKKDGSIFVAFISAYAPIIDLLKNYPEELENYGEDALLRYLQDGKNIVSDSNPGFTTAYFEKPDKIELFMGKFGLNKQVIAAIEGLAAQSEPKLNNLSKEAFDKWVNLIFHTSTDPLTWASCEHLLYIGKKIDK